MTIAGLRIRKSMQTLDEEGGPMFQDGDVLCFLGDSITANGRWMAEVYQNLREKYGVKCYNCGVSGGMTEFALFYLDSQCLVHSPDYVVMMFGINDIYRELYTDGNEGDAECDAAKQQALDTHKACYEKLIRRVQESGAKVILCTPPPYDDVNEKEEYSLLCQPALLECVEFVKELAERYDLPVVDFYGTMYPLLGEREWIEADRVHPTAEGQHVLAQIFLRDIGETEKCDFDSPFLWEAWNKCRFDAEQELILVNFIEFCVLLKDKYIAKKTIEERKAVAKREYESYEDKTEVFPRAYADYIAKIDSYQHYMDEVVRLTRS